MKKHLIRIYLLSSMLLILGACSDNNENQPDFIITVGTPAYTELSADKVKLTAVISGESGKEIIKKGFCYATDPDPDIFDNVKEVTGSNKEITGELTGLSPHTTYYVKAFVTAVNSDPVYSGEISFTTLEGPNIPDDYKAPAYLDNYINITDWSQRHLWNLANVHDPTVMKADDGYFYMYQTDASYGNVHAAHGHFHARRSKDLVNWEYLGATMTATPTWVKEKLNEIRTSMGLDPIQNPVYGYWAPTARQTAPGKYRMYYCIIIDNYIKSGLPNIPGNFDNSWTERAFIGMMETSDPASNRWEDKGYVLCSSTDLGMNDWYRPNASDWNGYFKWNAIDPSLIITETGEHWLIYGSWHSGITGIQLDPESGKPMNEPGNPWEIPAESGYGKLIATRDIRSRWQGSEAPEIIYNPKTGYYYLFMAYDELSVAYNTRVARSRHITGPYTGIDGTDVTAGGEMYPVVTHPYKFKNGYGWVGLSHCAVFDDGNGNWYYASQGRFPHNVPGIHASNALMMGHVRSIRWTSSGWPVIMPERYGAVPEVKITESEIAGNWEVIDLSYAYGRQKEASDVTLTTDRKVTAGIWKNGSWEFDSENQRLTINGIELCVQREVDWESEPRTPTLVFGGYNGQKTYWGKKVN